MCSPKEDGAQARNNSTFPHKMSPLYGPTEVTNANRESKQTLEEKLRRRWGGGGAVSYTHLRAHETG